MSIFRENNIFEILNEVKCDGNQPSSQVKNSAYLENDSLVIINFKNDDNDRV